MADFRVTINTPNTFLIRTPVSNTFFVANSSLGLVDANCCSNAAVLIIDGGTF
jgi:hypothetical protein